MIGARPRLMLAAAALPVALGGCVAAALPIAAGAMAARSAVKPKPARRAQPPVVALPVPRAGGRAVLLPGMTALPVPTGADGYAAFADFALAWAAKPKPENGGLSAVLTAESQLPQIQRVPCRQLPPAVVIDLDPDRAIFAPEAPGTAQPGLAARLSALRAAGITVMWQSALGVEQVSKVYDALRRSGLDPEGVDRLLLVRQADERKHTRRLAATRDWCILAVAGDRDGDFDELFDYLRNPDYALPLAPLRGAGWFTAPPPIQPAPNATESPSQ
ncbi:MAG TPA: hypothetical protein VF440_01130 [Novosphingobium sp.]